MGILRKRTIFFSPYRNIDCQYGLSLIGSLLEKPPENPIRQRIKVLMRNASSHHGLSEDERDELSEGMKKYRVYIDSGASMSVVKHKEMLIPGTFRAAEGNIFFSVLRRTHRYQFRGGVR